MRDPEWGTFTCRLGPRVRRRVPLVASLALVASAIAACTGGASPNLPSVDPSTAVQTTVSSSSPGSTAPPSSAAAPSSATSSASAATTTGTISAAEVADRAAAEAQWSRYWEIYAALPHTPEDQWDALLAPLAVEPMITNAKNDAQSIRDEGHDTYGTVGHRFSWTDPIAGADTALLHDCNDGSQAGAFETATGNKITVGVPRQNTMGTLVRSDGVWKVSAAYIVKDTPC
jgi:hypothetical protein